MTRGNLLFKIAKWWLASRVVSVLDWGAEGPGSNRSRSFLWEGYSWFYLLYRATKFNICGVVSLSKKSDASPPSMAPINFCLAVPSRIMCRPTSRYRRCLVHSAGFRGERNASATLWQSSFDQPSVSWNIFVPGVFHDITVIVLDLFSMETFRALFLNSWTWLLDGL